MCAVSVMCDVRCGGCSPGEDYTAHQLLHGRVLESRLLSLIQLVPGHDHRSHDSQHRSHDSHVTHRKSRAESVLMRRWDTSNISISPPSYC